MKDFKDKVAVITGAGSGIGRGLAEVAANNKMRLVLADVDEKGLNETLDVVKNKGVEAIARITDVSNLNEVENLASQTYEIFQNSNPENKNSNTFVNTINLLGNFYLTKGNLEKDESKKKEYYLL